MKLLLASKEKFLIDKGYSLLDIPKDELRIGIITTALEVVEDVKYLTYVEEYRQAMLNEDIYFEEFDISNKTEKEILKFFSDKNVVQVLGGNVFYLLKHIRKSGFDKILKGLLTNGLCYVGCSAGSYLMCPTIEVAGWNSAKNKYGVTDFTALGYVPFLIKCHYTEDIKEKVLEKAVNLKYPLRILRNDQAFLVEGEIITFIGDEEDISPSDGVVIPN
jgi:dipeptidase E